VPVAQKEFVSIIEENIFILNRLRERLRVGQDCLFGYTRQQVSALIRLYVGGRAKLKDIAAREFVTAPNLCAAFRTLEADGLVMRVVDDGDRRNTWYAATRAGEKLAERILAEFRRGIAELFENISAKDEKKLTVALTTINELLKEMERKNA
jgi:DNA-binding MarR family transcriptional regulator